MGKKIRGRVRLSNRSQQRVTYETSPQRAEKLRELAHEMRTSRNHLIDYAIDAYIRSLEAPAAKLGRQLRPLSPMERQCCDALIRFLRKRPHDAKLREIVGFIIECEMTSGPKR